MHNSCPVPNELTLKFALKDFVLADRANQVFYAILKVHYCLHWVSSCKAVEAQSVDLFVAYMLDPSRQGTSLAGGGVFPACALL